MLAQHYPVDVIAFGGEPVSAVTQDQLGFLYIGTTSGVHRYDGRRLQKLQSPPHAYSLQVDSVNRIWVATLDGIFVVQGLAARQITKTGMNSLLVQGDTLFALGWDRGDGDAPLIRMKITPTGLSASKMIVRGHGPLHLDPSGNLWLACGLKVCAVARLSTTTSPPRTRKVRAWKNCPVFSASLIGLRLGVEAAPLSGIADRSSEKLPP